MIGTHLGPYEIQSELGRGGMATVYRAYHAGTDRWVAAKVIHQDIARDPSALERFRREARLIARLENPHILPIYDFDGTSSPPYIIMRYINGGTLKEVLGQQRLTVEEIGFLLKQIAAGLDYAHAQGIVHRDIKPSNILLDRQGNAFVSDFGIARMFGAQPTGSRLTQMDEVVGTPDYMAPEQALGQPVDARTDVYALAVMIFQMVTGHLPFAAEQAVTIILKHLQEPPPSAHALNPALPPALDAVLAQGLAKPPEGRPGSAGALVTAVLQALGGPAEPRPGLTASARPAGPLQALLGAQTPTPPPAVEQNRQVTVLHVDLAEFGEVVEQAANPEAARDALRTLHQRISECVHAWSGQLLTQNDTRLVAIWGAQAAHEDDPEHAVRAGLEILDRVQAQAAALIALDPDEPPLARLGANTGPVLLTPDAATGVVGAVGATLTVADRLAESLPGGLLISQDTYHQVRGAFELRPDQPLKLRGRKTPLATYRVTAYRASGARHQPRAIEGVETRLIGRTAELKQLQNAYLNAVEDNETQVVTVLGEAGLGKSRLLYEFYRWVELRPEPVRQFTGRATPATTARPYALLRELLSEHFDILDNDPVATVRAKMEAGVAALSGAADLESAHLIGHLAGFDFGDSPHVRGLLIGDPKQMAQRARQLWARLIVRLSQTQPVMVVLEDLHHADDATLDLLDDLATAQPNSRLLIIGLARPALMGRRPAWGSGRATHHRLTLAPLDKRDSRDLAREILQKVAEVPKDLRDLLVERAEGNPLFMEELVKILVEDRIITKDSEAVWVVEASRLAGLRVPPTLVGLLQTRVDTLLQPERLTLQRAAVIGRVFFDTALQALDAADDVHVDVAANLARLEAREFVVRRASASFAGSTEYIFTKAMVREVVYDSLIARQRQTYHAAMARWLAAGDRAAEYLPLIAEHYERAGDPVHAAAALEQAGDRAMQVSAFRDALRFYQHARGVLEAPGRRETGQLSLAGPRPDPDQQARLLTLEADAQQRLADFPAAKASLAQALQGATSPETRAAALALLAEIRLKADGDTAGASALLTEALPLAEAGVDHITLARVHYGLGIAARRTGDYARARSSFTTGLAIARAQGAAKYILACLNGLGLVGRDPDEQEGHYQEFYQIAQSVGDRHGMLVALNNLGSVAEMRHDLSRAYASHEEALVLARELEGGQIISTLLTNLGNIGVKLGRLEAARAHLHEALTLARQLGIVPLQITTAINIGNYLVQQGDRDRALRFYGLAQQHPAFSDVHRRELAHDLAGLGQPSTLAQTALASVEGLDLATELTAWLAEAGRP